MQGIKYMSKICTYPFYHAEINIDGNVSCCCPDFTDFYYLGNIYEQNFEEIWYGEKWKNFRENILAEKYDKCHTEICKGLDDEQFKSKEKMLKEYIECIDGGIFPQHITLSIDSICNVQCIMCRDWNLPLNTKEQERLKANFEKFLYMMKDAKRITLDGSGEVFASQYHKRLIKAAVARYPKLKFDIFTNGLMCNEKTLRDFCLTDRLNMVTVSLHAGCEKTYNRIVKGSNYEKVLKNIKYLSELKKEGKLKGFALTFVLSSLNFKDLPDFVKIAVENDAYPNIWPIRPYNNCRVCNSQNKYDITIREHPRFNELLEILENPILKEHHLLINKQITNLFKEDRKGKME